jgi:transcriptional antiterminator
LVGRDVVLPLNDYEVVKVFNNNVLLAKQNTTEKILIKSGIGYGRKPGERIAHDFPVDKIFVIENPDTSGRFHQLLTEVEPNLVGLCEEILWMISLEINETLHEEIHVRLIDHIAFALYRLSQNDAIENPFVVEIQTLYNQEFAIAAKVVAILEKNTGLAIPDSETGFIALHIYSLRNREKPLNSIKCAYVCNSIVELIEDELQLEIDRRSIDYARFVCHIRFAVERIARGMKISNDLLASIKKTYKCSFKLARQVSRIIEEELNLTVPETETGYITMHIERLRNVTAYVDK